MGQGNLFYEDSFTLYKKPNPLYSRPTKSRKPDHLSVSTYLIGTVDVPQLGLGVPTPKPPKFF